MIKEPNKQVKRGRPKKPINDANLPEKPLAPKAPKAPVLQSAPKPSTGELPKKIVGSHMGLMQTGGGETAPVIKGPAIPRPVKPLARGPIAPTFKK